MPTLPPLDSGSVRSTLAEQFVPVLRVHAQLRAECTPVFDLAGARKRVHAGHVAFDADTVILAADDLRPAFHRVLAAFEIAGMVSNDDSGTLHERTLDVREFISAWLSGDSASRDNRRRAARQAAILVANAVLSVAAERIRGRNGWSNWTRAICPCCGGAPDIALRTAAQSRVLICARCDARWTSARMKCLGCDSDQVARIHAPKLEYDLLICNACGRFIMEREEAGLQSLIVERAITTELVVAAEQRGLRF